MIHSFFLLCWVIQKKKKKNDPNLCFFKNIAVFIYNIYIVFLCIVFCKLCKFSSNASGERSESGQLITFIQKQKESFPNVDVRIRVTWPDGPPRPSFGGLVSNRSMFQNALSLFLSFFLSLSLSLVCLRFADCGRVPSWFPKVAWLDIAWQKEIQEN